MYNYDGYGYDGFGYGWGWNRGNMITGTDDNCAACAGGRIGCGWTTYHNNELYGSCSRTVKFIRIERRCICGEDVDVLIPDMEFFDRFRNDCQKCRNFVAEICACIEFGDTRKVFIADGPGCKKLLPLETARNGFMISADQIQPFSNGHCKLIMTTCYDCFKNDHVTISNYYRSHAKCDCRKKCGCECENFEGMRDGVVGVDGFVDGVDGMLATY